MFIKLVQVQFIAEEAIDAGGPSREFWRLFVRETMQQYCVGEPGVSLFDKNVPALQVFLVHVVLPQLIMLCVCGSV